MRVVFMGTPAAVTPVLARLCGMEEVAVAAAVTPPDRGQGRGRRAEPTAVKAVAMRLGVPVWQPEELRSRESLGYLAGLRPDVIVVAAYRMFLPPAVLGLPSGGCLNLHPSLLPRHRGASPVAAAIVAGDDVTGVSLMLMDAGMDRGPVIARREYALDGTERAGELTERLFALGADLLADCLAPWMEGELSAIPQDEAGATVSRRLERGDGLADWGESAVALERRLRGYDPWPGLYTTWGGRTLKLLEVTVLPDARTGAVEPGTVVAVGTATKGLYIVTGDGLLVCSRLQLEGRRAITGEEFLRGYPDIVGARLGDGGHPSTSSG